MKEEKIKVLALLPMELPKEIELDNTLEAMQNFVGGLIECITSDCPYRTGSLHWYIYLSPGMAEALSDSKIWGYGGVRFGVPNVQKCRRGFCSVRRPLP